MNVCAGCKEDFASVEAFDAHRVGQFGPGEFKGWVIDWTSKQGRRCLDREQLVLAGFERNAHGRWVDAKSVRNRPVEGGYSVTDASEAAGQTRKAA